eukprot:TRINITY_DN28521_c0_g1_i1.p1 TRINITY_DN28521_c0_g1~~TRINITY_DN28521_c0_g1_i1.p1  ORF type:complete len:835 (+),score=301.64 TRINITY_DN28521_c0_g1_i1:56-2506(+)
MALALDALDSSTSDATSDGTSTLDELAAFTDGRFFYSPSPRHSYTAGRGLPSMGHSPAPSPPPAHSPVPVWGRPASASPAAVLPAGEVKWDVRVEAAPGHRVPAAPVTSAATEPLDLVFLGSGAAAAPAVCDSDDPSLRAAADLDQLADQIEIIAGSVTARRPRPPPLPPAATLLPLGHLSGLLAVPPQLPAAEAAGRHRIAARQLVGRERLGKELAAALGAVQRELEDREARRADLQQMVRLLQAEATAAAACIASGEVCRWESLMAAESHSVRMAAEKQAAVARREACVALLLSDRWQRAGIADAEHHAWCLLADGETFARRAARAAQFSREGRLRVVCVDEERTTREVLVAKEAAVWELLQQSRAVEGAEAARQTKWRVEAEVRGRRGVAGDEAAVRLQLQCEERAARAAADTAAQCRAAAVLQQRMLLWQEEDAGRLRLSDEHSSLLQLVVAEARSLREVVSWQLRARRDAARRLPSELVWREEHARVDARTREQKSWERLAGRAAAGAAVARGLENARARLADAALREEERRYAIWDAEDAAFAGVLLAALERMPRRPAAARQRKEHRQSPRRGKKPRPGKPKEVQRSAPVQPASDPAASDDASDEPLYTAAVLSPLSAVCSEEEDEVWPATVVRPTGTFDEMPTVDPAPSLPSPVRAPVWDVCSGGKWSGAPTPRRGVLYSPPRPACKVVPALEVDDEVSGSSEEVVRVVPPELECEEGSSPAAASFPSHREPPAVDVGRVLDPEEAARGSCMLDERTARELLLWDERRDRPSRRRLSPRRRRQSPPRVQFLPAPAPPPARWLSPDARRR